MILLSRDAVWISVHSVAERAMALLGREAMSAEELSRPEEWRRHRDAVMTAAGELQDLYGRPVRFVHPLPEAPSADAVADVVAGGGFDLDSLVTVLPQPDGTLRALVADVGLGARAIAAASDEELARFAATYRMKPAADLRAALAAMQQAPRAAALAGFLDRIAAHMRTQIAGVERVPLLFVAVASLDDAANLHHDDFQITWNNVVLENAGGVRRAEGFASGLETADREVAGAFARAGYQLDYVPVLPDSVILLGGYRCASQHVRQMR